METPNGDIFVSDGHNRGNPPVPHWEQRLRRAGRGVAADGQGNIYGAEVGPKDVKK
jgi:hypothetical protein